MRDLPGESASGFLSDALERRSQLRRDGCGNRSLHDRRLAEQDVGATLLRHELERHLRREDRASQIHKDQHPVVGPRPVDRIHHQHGVGADRMVGQVQTPGGLEPHVRSAHLAGELGDPFRDAMAMRDDDDSDHGRVPGSGSRGQHADERHAVRDRHDPRTSRPRATKRLALTESPKSKSTERRPSIAWVVTTTRNRISSTNMTGLEM